MKDFLTLARERCSIRSYEKRMVEKEKRDLILEAGRLAPTGCNRQGQKFIVVESEDSLDKLSKAGHTYGAPLAIVVCIEKGSSWTRPCDGRNLRDTDAAIVTDHMMMEATDLGLGSCWICNFNPDVLKKELSIPENLEPVNILLAGYASGEGNEKSRRPLSSFVSFR